MRSAPSSRATRASAACSTVTSSRRKRSRTFCSRTCGRRDVSALSPWSLAWLGLLVPLILLYVLKRRRDRKVVSSTLLWEAVLRDLRAERPWQRLRPHLSLILQALVLIVGALALARPAGAGQ